MKNNLPKLDKDGKYPAWAWPGGYTIIYFDAGGMMLCADCASPIFPIEDTPYGRAKIIGCETYDEGPTIPCDDCGKEIESSYGDPDYEEEN